MKTLIIITSLCCANIIQAQTVTGYVLDSRQQPLPYVSCLLRTAADFTYVAGTITRADGGFELPAETDRIYILQLAYLGYESREITCGTGDLGAITLQENVQMLGQAVVKGNRPLVKLEADRLSYNIAGWAEQRLLGSAHELIKELPSVPSMDGRSLSLVGAASTTICISGKVSQKDAEQLNDYLNALPAEQVDRIEVLYNAPPQWHVKGAVINVVLKKRTRHTMNGQWQAQWENQHRNAWNTGGSILVSTPKWDFDLMYKFADAWSVSRNVMQCKHLLETGESFAIVSSGQEDKKSTRHTIYTGLGHMINEKNSLNLIWNGRFTPGNRTESWSRNTLAGDARSLDAGHSGLHNVQLSYTLQNYLSAGVNYTAYSNAGTQRMLISEDKTFADAFTYWRKQHIGKVYGHLDMNHALNRGWMLTYGVNYNYVGNRNSQQYDDVQSGGTGSYRKTSVIEEHTAVFYAGTRKSFWNDRLSVSASLSGELYEINGYKKNALLPDVELSFTPSDHHVFQASYQHSRGYPSYWERQDYISFNDAYTMRQGNPVLRPALTSVLDLIYILKNRYIFQISYYRVDDFIIQQCFQLPDRLNLLYQPFNMEFTSSWQFNAIIPFSWGKWYNASLVMGAYDERYKNDDWYGYTYDRLKWVGTITLDNSFTILQRPKLVADLFLGYRTPTIQGIWDLSAN